MTELHRTNQLQERYDIGKQTVYDRMEALRIKPVKRGFISEDQLKSLDRLNEHIKYGGTVNDFLIKLSLVDNINGNSSTIVAAALPPLPQLLTLEQINEIIDAIKQTSRIQKFRDLSELASKELIVPSSLLKLMGISPRLKKGQKRFRWGSFEFHKSTKLGRENGWFIKKIAIIE